MLEIWRLRTRFERSIPVTERKNFWTDGVRGVANVEPVTAETARNQTRCGVCVRAK
jgi:hypothetical protein